MLVTVEDCDGVPVRGLGSAQLRALEDGVPLPASSLIDQPPPALFLTLLIDVSDPSLAARPGFVAAARKLIDGLQLGKQLDAHIAIELFDGAADASVWQPHTLDNAKLNARLDVIDQFSRTDPASTDLNGAVLGALRRASNAASAFQIRNGYGVEPQGYVVVLTAGRDTANRLSFADLALCLDPSAPANPADFCTGTVSYQSPSATWCGNGGASCGDGTCCPPSLGACSSTRAGPRCSVGVPCDPQFMNYCTGSTRCSGTSRCCCTDQLCVDEQLDQRCGPLRGFAIAGIGLTGAAFDAAALERLAGARLFTVPASTGLEAAASRLLDRIDLEVHSRYLVAWCSPARAGQHVGSVEAPPAEPSSGQPDGGPSSTPAELPFSADNFQAGCSAQSFDGLCTAKECGSSSVFLAGCGFCDDRVTWCDTTQARCRPHCEADAGYCALMYTTAAGYPFTCVDKPTATQCSGTCQNLQTSLLNCGVCGNACASGAVCDAGTCDCGVGSRACGASCRNLTNDVYNCGACNTMCGNANASAVACFNGGCRPTCRLGWADCDDAGSTGCETSTDFNIDNCGACNNRCPSPPNATAGCGILIAGLCGYSCSTGYRDCDGQEPNGCETNIQTSVTSCGGCGRTCPVGTLNADDYCDAGACVAPCRQGYSDCDTVRGCETRTSNDVMHCGNCSTQCPVRTGAQTVCDAGTCGFVCNVGRGDCDGQLSTGCEAQLAYNDLMCGACGNACDAGQACNEFTCRPVLARDVDPYVASDGTYVYFTDGLQILRTQLGGSPSIVASVSGARELRVDGTDLFFITASPITVRRVPKAGGTATVLYTGIAGLSALAVDATSVYFGENGSLKKIARSGGAVTTLVASGFGSLTLALDSTSIYWTDALGAVLRVPKAGGAVTPIVMNESSPHGIITANGNLIWNNSSPQPGLRQMPLSIGAIQDLPPPQSVQFLVSDGLDVYYVSARGELERTPLDGGMPQLLDPGTATARIALDATHVYYVSNRNLYWGSK